MKLGDYMKKSFMLLIIILFIFINGFCIFYVTKQTNKVKVSLKGNDYIKVGFGSEYNDEGVFIKRGDKELSLEDMDSYDVISNVDLSNVGTYEIKYNFKYQGVDYSLVRKVEVVDYTAPQITTNVEKVTIGYCDSKAVDNLDYKAVDDYDGDITTKVVKEEKDDKFILSVTDSNGNTTTKELRKIQSEKPADKITLNGKSYMNVVVNTTYEEPGAYISDGCGNKLEGEVEITGSVDTTKVGKYDITYTAKDNKELKAVRTVNVYEKKATDGVIYLTFDDGPGGYTSQILDVLKKYNIKATFFVTLCGSDAMIKREFDEGHTVALHTATHNYKVMYASLDAYLNDLQQVSDRVKRITGTESKYVRFPGGTSNRVSKVAMSEVAAAVTSRGYEYFDWNVCVEDAGSCVSASDKRACVVSKFKSGISSKRSNIVLLHDIKSYTAAGLEEMIKYALNNGYTFRAIDANTSPVHFKAYR
jgi:peptidoglycan/xylan/chitin deacetylase (PgdA/CDA1 family)